MRPPGDRTLILLAACLLLAAAPLQAETLRLRADLWYPFNAAPGDARPGFTIEVLEQIFSAHGIALDYQLAPWSRALELVHGGEADCVVGAYREEAPDLLYPRQYFAVDVPTFYVLAGDPWRYQGKASLDGKLVGVVDDYSYGEKFDTWMKAHPHQVNVAYGDRPLLNNVRMLLAGRVNVVVETPAVMKALLSEHGLEDQLREAGADLSGDARLYLACTNSPRGRLFTEQFDAGWQRLQASGVLDEIYGRYGVTPP